MTKRWDDFKKTTGLQLLASHFYLATAGTRGTYEQVLYDVARDLDTYGKFYHLPRRELMDAFNAAVEKELLSHGGDPDSYGTKETIEFRDPVTGKMTSGEVKRFSLVQAILGDEMSGDELEHGLKLFGYSGAPRDILGDFIAYQKLYRKEPTHFFLETIGVGAPIFSSALATPASSSIPFILFGLAISGGLVMEDFAYPTDSQVDAPLLIGMLIVMGYLCKNSPNTRAASMALSASIFLTRNMISAAIDLTTGVTDDRGSMQN